MYCGSKSIATTVELRDLQDTRVEEPLIRVDGGRQVFDEIRIRVIDVTQRLKGRVHRGANESDALPRRAENLKAVVGGAAKSPCEGIVMDESRGKSGGDDVEGIGGGNRRLGDIGTDVTEGDVEVGIVVEVGKGKDVVMVEWGWRGSDDSGFGDFDFHFGPW